MEEIDLFLATDDLMPLGIKNDDYDSEEDIHFREELLSDDPFPLPENESSNFDQHEDPSFPHPPSKPPDVQVFFDFEPNTGVLTDKWWRIFPNIMYLCLKFYPPNPPFVQILILCSRFHPKMRTKCSNLRTFLIWMFRISIFVSLDQALVWGIESGSRLSE
nr:hypothetical protein [Tanacetum cinerariifolium]